MGCGACVASLYADARIPFGRADCRGSRRRSLPHRRSRQATVRRHLRPVVQPPRTSRPRNRCRGHRTTRAIRPHYAAWHDAPGCGGAGAAAGRGCPSRTESRLLLRQRRNRGRGGAEDGVPVPTAHARQGSRPACGVSEPGKRVSRRHARCRGCWRRRALPRHFQADSASVAEDAVALLLSLSDRQNAGGLFDRLCRRARARAAGREWPRVRRHPRARRASCRGHADVAGGFSVARG